MDEEEQDESQIPSYESIVMWQQKEAESVTLR